MAACNPLLFWIQSFLTNRSQSVRVGSSLSSPRRVISGIPQGSVLGPCLFNLFINDVTDKFTNVTAKLFADDVKLYTELSSPTSVTNFQSHLDLIQSWSTTWQINISYTKCNILEIGNHLHHSAIPFLTKLSHMQTSSKISECGSTQN